MGDWVRIKGRQALQKTEGGPLSECYTPLLHPWGQQLQPLGQGEDGTHLASEGLLPGVLQRVHLERHAAFEGLPTGLAGEGHVLGVGYGAGTMAVTALGDPTCPGACLIASVPGPGAVFPGLSVCLL